MRTLRRLTPLLALGILLACPERSPQVCDPGRVAGCPCANGVHGTQICYSDGTGWSSCDCDPEQDAGTVTDASSPADGASPDLTASDLAAPDLASVDQSGVDTVAATDGATGSDAQLDAAVIDDAAAGDQGASSDSSSVDGTPPADAAAPTDATGPADSSATGDSGAATDAGSPLLTIYDLQNPAAPNHPALNTAVELTVVVVTAVDTYGTTQGFWVQEPGGGKYSGIYVHKQSTNLFNLASLQVGDVVNVSGTYTEYEGQLSEIVLDTAHVIGSQAPLLPHPASDLGTDPEGWEGVLIRTAPSCQVLELMAFGEVQTSCTLLDDEIAGLGLDVGQTFEAIAGVWHFSFGAFKLLPRSGLDFGPLVATGDAGPVDVGGGSDAVIGQDADVACSTIADARAAAAGVPVNLRLCDVLVTYERTVGFLVQSAASGPALFVFASPALLGVTVGDRLTLHVTALLDFENVREATQVEVLANDHGGHDVLALRQNLAAGAGVAPGEDLESELVRLPSAMVVSGNNRDWVIRYGSTPITASLYAYEGASAGLCAGATFELVTGYVSDSLDGYALRAYNLWDLANVDSSGCTNADMGNWDFEDYATSPIPGFEYLTGQFTLTQDSSFPHGGSSAAALTWTSQNNQDLRARHRSAVALYQRYTCHLWVYDNEAAGDIRVFIHWFDASDQFLSSSFAGTGVGYSVNQPAWQELTHGADAPPGAATMSCGVRMYDTTANWDGDATVLVDDLSISVP